MTTLDVTVAEVAPIATAVDRTEDRRILVEGEVATAVRADSDLEVLVAERLDAEAALRSFERSTTRIPFEDVKRTYGL